MVKQFRARPRRQPRLAIPRWRLKRRSWRARPGLFTRLSHHAHQIEPRRTDEFVAEASLEGQDTRREWREQMTDNALTACLWFDTEAEQAATFYTGIFKDSRLGRVHRHTKAGPGPAGSVMLVEFELNGQKFSALNGGPQFTFHESVAIVVPCADQA